MARSLKFYKYHFIYKITNIKNSKFYIGMHSTNNLDDGYLGGGTKIRNSIRRHGKEVHVREILEYFPDRISLAKRESEIINDDLLKNLHCLNIVTGGEDGFGFSEERLKEISDLGHDAFRKKLEDPEFKKSFGDKVREQNKIKKELGLFHKIDWTGRKHKEEAKKKIGVSNSIKQEGNNNSQYGRYWVCKNNVVLRINSNELDSYICDGWKRGKK